MNATPDLSREKSGKHEHVEQLADEPSVKGVEEHVDKFGAHEKISVVMEDGFSKVSIDTWLEVIPQVCAKRAETVFLLTIRSVTDHCSDPNTEC